MTTPLDRRVSQPLPHNSDAGDAATKAQPKVVAAIETWKAKLLDLTKRNRALNFKPTKVSTVAIIDEQPAEVFRQLYLGEQSMRFKALLVDPALVAEPPAVNGPEAESSDNADEAVSEDVDEAEDESSDDATSSHEFAAYDRTAPIADHTDGWLRTSLESEGLDKSLRRIDDQAKLALEEQGVNTLFLALGMLNYFESDDSDRTLRAPLILLPVKLERKSARAGYTVSASDDDPLVNVALSEYLHRSFGILLPELPDSEEMPDDYDLNLWFAEATDAVRAKRRWSVKTDVYLGLFSFQKFVMYKDLEVHANALSTHRLIRVLTGSAPVTESGVGGLPFDVRDMDLDREFAPEATSQVVDADSSQLRAIAAVSRNRDLVLEGPPGTGKSQTITNLIAQALAAGKSVLFVAEKMAALQVVHGRLVEAGLGEFCLQLHSTKASKREVVQQLARSLDASVTVQSVERSASERIGPVRDTLTSYVHELHRPHGKLGISPFAAYGALASVITSPRVQLDGSVEHLTREDLAQVVRDLDDLAVNANGIGIASTNPWRDATRSFYTADDLEEIQELGANLTEPVRSLRQRCELAAPAFGLPQITSLPSTQILGPVADVLGQSPGASSAVLASEAWNSPPISAMELIDRGRRLAKVRSNVKQNFKEGVCDRHHADDIAYIERRLHGIAALFASLDGRYREIKRRWLAYRLPTYGGSLADQARDLRQADQVTSEQKAVRAAENVGKALFGELWKAEASSWDSLEAYVQWVTRFRETYRTHGLTERAIAVAAQPKPDVSDLRSLLLAGLEISEKLSRLQTKVGWPADYLLNGELSTIESRVAELVDRVSEGPQWAAFQGIHAVATRGPAASLLPAAMSGELSFGDLPDCFLRAFYSRWLSDVVSERKDLAHFHTMSHEERVREFRRLDTQVLLENRRALINQLRQRVQQEIREPATLPAMQFLRRQMARQRGLAPLRRTIREAGPAIRAIKPCLLMSPLSVAQYLGPDTSSFDLVIFDEASQLPAEDAVGAILRSKQLTVVGDPKQLPPTTFFSALSEHGPSKLADDGTVLYEDSESVLEEFLGAGVASTRLKWHYRSAHESLIQFSNANFYESELYTFPSVDTSRNDCGLQFEFVPDGFYEGKGRNLVEARRVAHAVVAFAKEQEARRAAGKPVWSLGVGTFNMRQQLAIQDELNRHRRDDPSLDSFFAPHHEGFFVKNLENIQGDERDVIFLSVTYAKSPDGKLRQNFGPLNGENGWRRLNVIVTRARQRMRVFSSMHGDEISIAGAASPGPRLLREFLLYAERGHLESSAVSLAASTESPFEQDVLNELLRRGINVLPQIGVAGYRIDLGILDDVCPGRFLCGIECDGLAYHSSESARDRDRLRQQILEGRGWTILRVWSTDFFKDRKGQIDRLVRLIDECRTKTAARSAMTNVPSVPEVPQDTEVHSAFSDNIHSNGSRSPYQRPVAAAYVFAAGQGKYAGQDITIADLDVLRRAIAHIVTVESPIHADDLMTRIVGMWGTRAGRRIAANIGRVIDQTERSGLVCRRGEFYWIPKGICTVRSRAGTQIPGDRIPPEEYETAIRQILHDGHSFFRQALIAEVRSVFGFDRTGSRLDAAIGTVIDQLLEAAVLGEGSAGIILRNGEATS